MTSEQILDGILAGTDASREMAIAGLWPRWEEILGSSLADMLIPLGHRGSVLRIGAKHHAMLQEASYLTPLLLERINTFLGQDYFFQDIHWELAGRHPALNQRFIPSAPPQPLPQPPHPLGNLDIPAHSPVARAYRAYVRRLNKFDIFPIID